MPRSEVQGDKLDSPNYRAQDAVGSAQYGPWAAGCNDVAFVRILCGLPFVVIPCRVLLLPLRSFFTLSGDSTRRTSHQSSLLVFLLRGVPSRPLPSGGRNGLAASRRRLRPGPGPFPHPSLQVVLSSSRDLFAVRRATIRLGCLGLAVRSPGCRTRASDRTRKPPAYPFYLPYRSLPSALHLLHAALARSLCRFSGARLTLIAA